MFLSTLQESPGMRYGRPGRTLVKFQLVPSIFKIDSLTTHSRACDVQFPRHVGSEVTPNPMQDHKESCMRILTRSFQNAALRPARIGAQANALQTREFCEMISAASSPAFGIRGR